MRVNNCCGLWLRLLGFWLSLSTFMAQANTPEALQFPHLLNLNLQQLESRLSRAQDLQVLTNTGNLINGEPRCGGWVRTAKEAKQALLRLNQTYASNPTREYQQQALGLKQKNTDAIDAYQRCFAEQLPGFPGATALGASSYDNHRMLVSWLTDELGVNPATELQTYIDEVQWAMARLQQGQIVARALEVQGVVELRAVDGSSWVPLTRGRDLRTGDRIRSAHGRAGIQFVQGENNHALFFLANNTEIEIKPREISTLELLRGILRAVVRSIGTDRSGFSVRAGATLCGIRGTELAIIHDPTRNIIKHFLLKGDADVQVGGQRQQLQPNTHVQTLGGQMQRLQATEDFIWNSVADLTRASSSPPRVNTANPEPNNLNDRVDPETPDLALERGRVAVVDYLYAMQQQDQQAVLASMVDPMRGHYINAFAGKSLEQLLRESGDRPVSYSFRCSYCRADQQQCEYLVDLHRAVDAAGQSVPVLFTVVKAGQGYKVSYAARNNQDAIAAFRAKVPACAN